MPSDDKITFDSNIRKISKSYYLRVPKQIKKHLLYQNGMNIKLMSEKGQFGKYMTFWAPSQQVKDMPKTDKLTLNTKIRKMGSSYYIRMPQEAQKYLNLRENSRIEMQVEAGKFGKYVSFWPRAWRKD